MENTARRILSALILISLLHFSLCSNRNLPQHYKMQNYKTCMSNNNTYCVFEFKITPENNNTEIWAVLRENQINPLQFDHSILHRMICMPNSVSPESHGKQTIQNELADFNVTVDLLETQCEQHFNFSYFKTFLWLFVATYLIIVVRATATHYESMHDSKRACKVFSWYKAFSVIENCQKILMNNTNKDFQRLKAIQGFRVFNIILVIFWHTVFSLIIMYITDIKELEQNYENPLFYYLMFAGAFSVQIFFVISTLLLTNQVLTIYKREGKFTLHYCGILILNRIFRFLPTLIIVIMLTKSGIYDGSPHTIKLRNENILNCMNSWWLTVFQLTFILPFHQICVPGYWYLSIDTFYYTMTLLILFIILKFNMNLPKITGILIGITTLSFTSYIYIRKYSFMLQPLPEQMRQLMKSMAIQNIYTAPLCSWTSSQIGILLGYFYFNNKEKKITINKKLQILWWLTFITLPLLVLKLSTKNYTGVMEAIMGAILKPLFVFPFGLGFLGMSFGLGGVMKTLLESRIPQILSNVTYCTYLTHFFVVFAKGVFLNKLLSYKVHHMIFWATFDICLSFILGFLFTVLFENPGLYLQKKFIPQIKSNNKTN
ncbi:hypothetical protein ABEB36_007335 [Hypothenemus hampei]|uniref:Acyltransferase 3 domain-containing protein n=1 Tax=Hypothenemus hampei TaxID=57062 RepID=A0ABD1ETQ5_HYPHA